MEGLSSLVNLRVLDVSSNKLTSVEDIQNLTQYAFCFSILYFCCLAFFLLIFPSNWNCVFRLEDIWLNDNQIESLDEFAEALTGSREKLTTIYLQNNPCVCSSVTLRRKGLNFVYNVWNITYRMFKTVYNVRGVPTLVGIKPLVLWLDIIVLYCACYDCVSSLSIYQLVLRSLIYLQTFIWNLMNGSILTDIVLYP